MPNPLVTSEVQPREGLQDVNPRDFWFLASQQRGRAGGQDSPQEKRHGHWLLEGRAHTEAQHPLPGPLAPIKGVKGNRISAGRLQYLVSDGWGKGGGVES